MIMDEYKFKFLFLSIENRKDFFFFEKDYFGIRFRIFWFFFIFDRRPVQIGSFKIFHFIYDINEMIGWTLYLLGFKYKVSTSIAGNITYGYGKLDDYGYWQYSFRARTRVLPRGSKRTLLIRIHDLLEDECMFYLNEYLAQKKKVPFPRNLIFKIESKIEIWLRKIVEKK